MAKVRLEDVYDEDDMDQFEETCVHTRKHKNPFKDNDDVYEKAKKKNKSCSLRKNRKAKTDFENIED